MVESVTPVADGIVKLRLVSPDGRDAAALDAGLAHRRRMRRHRTCRASTRCAAIPADANALEIAVLREAEGRGGSAWMHANVPAGDRLHDPSAPRNHFRLDESATDG